MLLALCACGAKKAESPAASEVTAEWTRDGYYADENENMLSVTWMDDIDEPGWYVGVMIGDIMTGWTLPQEGNTLHGDLNAGDESADPLIVTVSEEGEDGLLLTFEDGESYHFTPYDMPDATIFVSVNTEGQGMIGYEEGETVPELDPEWPYQSAQINLAEPETYTFAAAPEAGNVFVKWTKDGEDLSTEPVVTVLLDGSAEFIAVFEEDPNWQDPVMNYVGEYQCDRAHAVVESLGNEDVLITIEWGNSAWELARWDIFGRLDTETMTIEYSGVTKSLVTHDDNGEIVSQEPEYEDGTGTITFNDDGTFTWHEDQSEYGTDMVFEWTPADPSEGAAGRQDGERFEEIIVLEGMEETVPYEHIVNTALGFEMDYDYESFLRQGDAERERFISVWDDPNDPENYLELTHSTDDAETAAAAIIEELSREYDLTQETRELGNAGACKWIEASVIKGTNNMADQLQWVYIIPAQDGCIVARAHSFSVESEGFGHRFAYMMDTLAIPDGNGE